MLISVVVPMYNEAAGIVPLLARLRPVLEGLRAEWEIICVNDGSQDDTLPRLLAEHRGDPRIRIVDLSRNFGKEIALTAGLDHAIGQVVIPMDADLQHPPELIPVMVERWREGFEIVAATHRHRTDENWLRKFAARSFYRIIGRISSVAIPDNVGDFRLLSRPVVEAIKLLPERTRFMKGLFAWVGFRQTTVYFDREPRHAGSSTWSYWKLWNFALDGVFAFSSLPLKVWGYIGMAIAGSALFYAFYLVLRTMIMGIDIPGYASLIVGILFLGGVQLVSLGVIGEYLARVYDEVKGRPLYIVRQYHGGDIGNTPKC